jgi:hypothetical protein
VVITAGAHEAETNQSKTAANAEQGAEALATRTGKPADSSADVQEPPKRRLGFLGQADIPDRAFAPLDEAELRDWGPM